MPQTTIRELALVLLAHILGLGSHGVLYAALAWFIQSSISHGAKSNCRFASDDTVVLL